MNNTWTIYRKNTDPDRNPVVVVKELEYHGEWMEEEYVMVTVKSPVPVDFHYGDYLTYRGIKFEINYDPNFIKKARSGSYGEGFTYDNIKLYPVSVKLKDIAFKDVVLNDPSAPANTLVYSSLGTFAFFAGSVEDLADRIMANLNRDYNGEWRVYTPYKARSIQRNGNIGAWGQYYNGDGSTIQGKTDINIECQNLSVMDALKMAYTSFDLSFYVTGKVIVIGGKPISADYDFEYGKGNGLYEIERTHDDSQRIVTKLYAYGSDKNLPLNYYANIGKRIKVQIAHKTKREITMGNPELVLWVNKEFTKALRDAFSPTYEVKLTLGHLSARFGVCGNTYTYAEEQDDDTLDHTTEYMAFWALSSDANALAMYNILVSGSQLYVTGVNINEMPADFIETPTSYNYDAALSITKLMLPGFPTQSLFAWVVANGATHINYQTGQARWHGYDAIFSTDKSDPWIKSINAGNIGVREGTVEFDSSSDKEIFPTIEGTGFDEVAWCEQIEDNGHIDKELTFALQPMTVDGSDGDIEWDYGGVSISMKDGYCTGREFDVAEAKLNDNGDWELTMKRKKYDSLGVYFPYKSGSGNLYQIMGRGNHHGQLDGDHFVILGIPLPQSYVENAAAMLLEEALKHLAKVDHQSYTYLPRIDEIEMARQHDRAMASQGTITSIHDTICAGMQMQIDDDDLNVHYSPFIDNITIKENGNNGIPTYDVVLRDEKEMTMQERIQSQIDGGKDAIINSLSPEGEWLSKVSDDTAQGMITFLRGLQVGERFVTGLLGEGGVFRVEDDGTTYIEADKLYIRMKAYFDSVEIREYHHTGGNRIASVAGARCCRVEWIDSQGNVLEKTQANLSSVVKFRCYFMGNDGEDEVRNNWVVGDLAYCHITTVEVEQSDNPEAKGLNMRHYWRKVVGRNATGTLTVKGEHWIDLSNVSGEYQSGSDVPVAQDDIIQLGNVSDGDRQGAIIEFVTGADSPSYQVFQGINDFSLVGKNYVGLGYSTQTGRAYLRVYGDAFIGDPDESTYMKYDSVNRQLHIKAIINAQSTIDGQTIADFIAQNTWTEEQITGMITDETDPLFSDYDTAIKNIQKQIDGSIETWFYNGIPGPSSLPESEWKEKDQSAGNKNERLKHLGDLYYDNQTGYAYRYTNTGTENVPQFEWKPISDSAVVKALSDASKAQDTADNKRRVFFSQPVPPYDEGDLWVNATYPAGNTNTDDALHRYSNDVLRCDTAKESGEVFSISDWKLASKYTDDSALDELKANQYVQQLIGGTISQDINDAQTQAANAANAANAAQAAADSAQADADEANGRLDGWASDGVISPTEKTALRLEWADVKKEYAQICNDADKYGISKTDFASAYASANSAYTKYTAATPENITIGADYDNIAAYYSARQTILDAISAAAKKVATDAQEKADSAYLLGGNALSAAQAAEAHAAAFDAIKTALNDGETTIDGGLILTNLIALRDGQADVRAGINGHYSTTGAYGGGLAAWFGGGFVDRRNSDGTWNTVGAKVGFRFDGSGYVAGGAISWDATGLTKVTASKISTLEMDLGGDAVATQKWVGQNYLSVAFFDRLFRAYNGDTLVNANDTTSTIDNIKAMFGFWTDKYISALGKSDSVGGGGATALADLTDVLVGSQTQGQVLGWDGNGHWIPMDMQGGSDTKNTAGSMNLQGAGAKLYIVGATSQTPVGVETFSNSKCYIGTDDCLYSNGEKVLTSAAGYVTGITVNGGNPISPSSGIVSLGALAKTVKVGTTDYNVSSDGVISLPAYPSGYVTGIIIGGESTPRTPTNGIVSIPKIPTSVSQLTNDSGYISSITKAMVESVLTGNITSHTHSQYLTSITKAMVENVLTGDITTHTHSQYLTSHQTLDHLIFFDNRRENLDPYGSWTYKGVQYSLKYNTTDGLADGGIYHGSMTLHSWKDSSGGHVHQLGFTDNGRIWHRNGSSSWGNWSKIAYTSDIPTNTNQLTNGAGFITSSALAPYLLSSSYTASDVLSKIKTVDGSGSGLDADLLDGVHASGFVQDYGNSISTNIYNMPCKSVFSGFNVADAPVTGYISGLALGSDWNNNHFQSYLVESMNGRWYTTRSYSGGAMINWNTIAYLSDNVASATKLQTARTIWGQSFDGTGNVNGTIHINAPNGSYVEGIRIHQSSEKWATIALCSDDNTGASGTSAKTWCILNNDGAFYINKNGSSTLQASRLYGHANGWTVGNSSTTTYALNAASFICDSWVRTKGATGWYSETYGGGWYMIDSSWLRTYNEKSIYSGNGQIYTETSVRIGGCTISWDSTNNALKFDKTIYSDVGMSALGLSGSGSGTSGDYLPLTGGTLSGSLSISSGNISLGNGNIYVAGGGTFAADVKLYGKGINTRGSGRAWSWGGDPGQHYLGNDSSTVYMWTEGGYAMKFGTNNSERMRITSGGSVWIGTTTGGSFKFYVNGQSGGASAWANTSDMRLKNRIDDVDVSLDSIANAPLFRFTWKDINADRNLHIGTSAQYWKSIAPEVVVGGIGDYYGMEYGVTALIAAITTARKVKNHEQRIKQLENENRELRQIISELKAA